MRFLCTVVLASLLALPAGVLAGDGYVGIYADAQATIPCATIPPGNGATLYVVANLEGNSIAGISGAEFRVEVSNTAGWFLSYSSPTGVLTLGNIFDFTPSNPDDLSGVNLAFTNCQQGVNGKVTLGTIGVYNQSGSALTLSVKRHGRPSNAGYPCALFTLCDGVFSKSCMSTGSGSDCTLSKGSTISMSDAPIFVTGLNVIVEGGGQDLEPIRPARTDSLITTPALVANDIEPDIIGIDGDGGATQKQRHRWSAAADTTWKATWNFEGSGGSCSASGWTAEDNVIRNDGPYYWNISTEYNGDGHIASKAAVLKGGVGCWTHEGYGNNWDFSVKLRYRGASLLAFDYLLGSQVEWDLLTVEVDSADASNTGVDSISVHRRWPHQLRSVIYSQSGTHQSGRVTALALTDFGQPTVQHAVYLRFSSDATYSDEDNLFDSIIDAGLVVDNIAVTGGQLVYSENFEGAINANVSLINSGRSKPFRWNAPSGWGRLLHSIGQGGVCALNTGCAWLFTDPTRIASFPDMNFGPGEAVVRNWLDNVIISPWITLNPTSDPLGAVLKFREFGGNRYPSGRIMRAYAIRGLRNGSCVSEWSGDVNPLKGTWTDLSNFDWFTRIEDLSQFIDSRWDKVQVRFRVADFQAIGQAEGPSPVNPGPGPYLDDVRFGRVPRGPYIYAGPDTRFQAQDAFPTIQNMITPGEHFSPDSDNRFGTCAFSMAYDIGMPETEYLPGDDELITGDSIVVQVGHLNPVRQITKVAFYYRIIAGPHKGKKANIDDVLLSNGLARSQAIFSPYAGYRTFFMDFDDTYFRGGDVMQYFWYAEDDEGTKASFPPGISSTPDNSTFSVIQAEVETGGLLEVSFLPTIAWAPAYVARCSLDSNTGDLTPTGTELTNSTQANCILYVNKANADRRSGSVNRTSFMYTLDRLGYKNHYDVYDVQGSGNTNNDLGGRATVAQASGYALIVHDNARSSLATIPNGSDPFVFKINQSHWYRSYLGNAAGGFATVATLWVIGENWAHETQTDPLVATDIGLSQVIDNQTLAITPDVRGTTSFEFVNGVSASFLTPQFALNGGCPSRRRYDKFEASSGAVRTHQYATGSTQLGGAVVMKRHTGQLWNTIAMGFNWQDIIDASGGAPSGPRSLLASKILNGVLPASCLQTPATSTDTPPQDDVARYPAQTSLGQNHPNPANPSTIIPFDLDTEQAVMLRVFDVRGRLVRTLVDGLLEQQRHAVHWDGADDTGISVASGVYYYELHAGAYRATRRMVVIK